MKEKKIIVVRTVYSRDNNGTEAWASGNRTGPVPVLDSVIVVVMPIPS